MERTAALDAGQKSPGYIYVMWSTSGGMNHSVCGTEFEHGVAKISKWYGVESSSSVKEVPILWNRIQLCISSLQNWLGLTICSIELYSTLAAQDRVILKLLTAVNWLGKRREITEQKRICSKKVCLKFRVSAKENWIDWMELTIKRVDLHWN